MAEVTELVTKFSFQGDTRKLDDYNEGLGESIQKMGAFAAAATAAAGAVGFFLNSSLANLNPLVQMSRETGVAVNRLQELQFATEQTGGEAEEALISLRGLAEMIGDAAHDGGEGVEVFELLGISIRNTTGDLKDAATVFDEVRQAFSRFSEGERISFAIRLGMDASMVNLLSQTDEQMASLTERARALGVVSAEEADQVASYNESIKALGFGMASLRTTVAVGLAPQMQALSEGFTDFLAENRQLLKDGVEALAEGMSMLTEAFQRLMPIVAPAVATFVALRFATLGWAKALALITSPFLLIAAGVAAALLVLDDLIVAFQDGESVIRSFVKETFGVDITPILQDLKAAFDEMVDGVKEGFSDIAGVIGNVFDAVIALATGDFDGFIDEMKDAFDGLGDFITGMWDTAFDYLKGVIDAVVPGAVDSIERHFKSVFDWITGKIDEIAGGFRAVGEFLGVVDAPAVDIGEAPSTTTGAAGELVLPNLTPGGNTTNSSTSATYNLEVTQNIASSDPNQAGRAATDGLQQQMRDAQNQFARGGQ